MKKKKSIIKKLSKKNKGYVGVDYTITSKDKKKLTLYVLSVTVPILIGLLIFVLN